ncbi:MAG: hypothetical protein RR988_00985 [Clostridia bacterium]
MNNKKCNQILAVSLLVSIFFISAITCTGYFVLKERNLKTIDVSVDINAQNKKNIYATKHINKENTKIYYPVTADEKFNKMAEKIVNENIEKFEKAKTEDTSQNIQIVYNVTKQSENIYSFVFSTEIKTMLRPDTYIQSITYDFSKKEEITIDNLFKDLNKELRYISKYTYEELAKNPEILRLRKLKQSKRRNSASSRKLQHICSRRKSTNYIL